MRAYNGWSPAERMLVVPIQREAYRTGYAKSPDHCCVCGTRRGSFSHHCEDYTPKLGPHLFEYPVCYTCHMVIHCRFSAPAVFAKYHERIRAGMQLLDTFTVWTGFQHRVLQRFDELGWAQCAPPVRDVLQEILDRRCQKPAPAWRDPPAHR